MTSESYIRLMQVLSIDFGGKEWVEVSSLRQLPDGLDYFPALAMCCRLANIEPVTVRDSDKWPELATDYLINTMMPAGGRLLTAWLSDLLPVCAFVR